MEKSNSYKYFYISKYTDKELDIFINATIKSIHHWTRDNCFISLYHFTKNLQKWVATGTTNFKTGGKNCPLCTKSKEIAKTQYRCTTCPLGIIYGSCSCNNWKKVVNVLDVCFGLHLHILTKDFPYKLYHEEFKSASVVLRNDLYGVLEVLFEEKERRKVNGY